MGGFLAIPDGFAKRAKFFVVLFRWLFAGDPFGGLGALAVVPSVCLLFCWLPPFFWFLCFLQVREVVAEEF